MDHNESKKLAGKHYSPEMKKGDDELSKGLSLTHEQVLDNYMEGTVDGMIEKDDKSIPHQDLED